MAKANSQSMFDNTSEMDVQKTKSLACSCKNYPRHKALSWGDDRHTAFKAHTEFQRQFGTHICTRQCLLFWEGIFILNKKWCYNKCVSNTTMLLESKVEGLCVAVIQKVHRKAACPLAASLPRGP